MRIDHFVWSDWTTSGRSIFEFAAPKRNESIQHITEDDDIIWTNISKQIKDKKQFLNGFFWAYVLKYLYRSSTIPDV